MTLKELIEKRGRLTERMRDMVSKASEEDRGLSAEEQQEFDRLDTEQEELRQRIATERKLSTIESESLDDISADRPDAREIDGNAPNRDGERRQGDQPDIMRGMVGWLLAPTDAFGEEHAQAARSCGFNIHSRQITIPIGRVSRGRPAQSISELHRRYESGGYRESRALSVGTTTAGGYTVPDEMMRQIDIALLQYNPIRGTSTIISTASGADLPIPTCNDTAVKGEIIAENNAANEGDLTFGQLVLESYQYSSKIVRVSIQLLQDSATNIPAMLGELLGTRIGRIQADHHAVGTGTAQPKGIVTAATDSTITAASATALTYAEVLGLKHSVDPAYRGPGSGFMCNDTILLAMKTMADTTGRPLWMPDLIGGGPDRFDGSPVHPNQSMASGTATKALIFGQLDKYLIRDVLDFNLIRLDERYAEYGQVAFLGWYRSDADLLDAGTHPVKYLTMG